MFVMKSIFDQCINVNGGKLYSCFVDFRKAFDFVIHPGLLAKLKELDINGKFYDILSSLYTKSSVCVKLGDHRTDMFECNVGVRHGDILSPNLFKIFINELPVYLSTIPDQFVLMTFHFTA